MEQPDNAARAYGMGVLHPNPLVLHLIFLWESPFQFVEALSLALGNTPAIVLVANYWSVLSRWHSDLCFSAYLNDYRRHRSRYPQHQVILLANDALEQKFIESHGIDTALFQHNGFMHAYQMPRQRPKEFDAIAIARIERHKRLELAHNIESCCVVFGSANKDYYESIHPLVSNFVFANGDPLLTANDNVFTSTTPQLSRNEIAEWCARSRVGLCLSAEEGANFASAEYMVWGLPVVSTRSLGGRDNYFDDQFCLICDDDPAAVAAAVKEAISRNIDPELIRSTFLANVMTRRAALLKNIASRTAGWGGSLENFTRSWLDLDTAFLDRVRWYSLVEVLDEVRRAP